MHDNLRRFIRAVYGEEPLPQRAGAAAIAAGEGWPAAACGRGDGAKKAFILPIRPGFLTLSLAFDRFYL